VCPCSWLRQQPQYHNLWQVLLWLPTPSVLDASLAALNSPLLQLRVLQLKLRMVRLGMCAEGGLDSRGWVEAVGVLQHMYYPPPLPHWGASQLYLSLKC
jgi:hypothetical protein